MSCPLLQKYNEERTGERFANLSWYDQRVLIEAAVHRLPKDYVLIDHIVCPRTGLAYALGRCVGGNDIDYYATWLVGHHAEKNARWISESCYLVSGQYRIIPAQAHRALIERI